MKKLFLAGLLALFPLLALPNTSKADGWSSGRSAGFGWAGDKVLSCAPWIHQHGPLYNYTPMMGDYIWMQFTWHQLYNYTPAYPLNYPKPKCGANGCGGAGSGACNGGAFAGLFGCGLHSSSLGGCSSCGGSSWFGWFQKGGSGGHWANIFSKGCGTPACTPPSSACKSCTSSLDPTNTGVIQTGYSSSLYPEFLAPAWR